MPNSPKKSPSPLKTPRFDGIRLEDIFPHLTESSLQEQELIGSLVFKEKSQLDDREKFILQRRFWEGKLLNEIAWEMELSTVRIKQLHDRALQKVKRQLIDVLTSLKEKFEEECKNG